MENKNVAVLMAVFSEPYKEYTEVFIRTAVGSILIQTHEKFTFYIVLDGEQAEVRGLIESYKDKRIVIIEKEHTGLTDSLNSGLSYIKEPFILRQDADDYSDPLRLEVLLKAMLEDKKIGVIGDNYGVIDTKGNFTHQNTADPEKLTLVGLAGSIAGCSLFRAEAIRDVGGWKYEYAQDFYMLVSMRKRGWKIKSVKDMLYFYRQHDRQVSFRCKKRQRECHAAIQAGECDG